MFEGGDKASELKLESPKSTRRSKTRSPIKIKKKMKLMGSFRKPKITAKKGPKRSSNIISDHDHITPDIYDRAIDMYLQEKAKTLRFKNLDEHLLHFEGSGSEDSFHSDMSSDDSFTEDINFDETKDIEYEQMPQYDNIKYISPLFKHKYELSVWKAGLY